MAEAALGLWIVTMAGGVYLFGFTSDVGRPESEARASHLSPLLLFTHPLLAFAGLAMWIVYLIVGGEVLAWTTFGVLVVTVLLGEVMFGTTLRHKREDAERVRHALSPEAAADLRVAEQRIPGVALAAHGLTAGLTLLLVFLSALYGDYFGDF